MVILKETVKLWVRKKSNFTESFTGLTFKEIYKLGPRHKKVIEIFSRYRFQRLLDIGCGDGNFSILLKRLCSLKEVYGIDISESGVKKAKKNGVKAFRVDVDNKNLPFKDNYFDAIYAGEIIEHLFNPDHFLDEVYRVLKPKGIFVLDTPNLASLYNRIALLLGYLPFDMQVSLKYSLGHLYEDLYKNEKNKYVRASDHIRFFTLKSLILLLKKHNFSILNVYGSSDFISTDNPLISYLVKFIDSFLIKIPSLSRIIMIVSTKMKL